MIKGLTQTLEHLLHDQSQGRWLWKERRVHVVDGTTLTMPDTEANQQTFPQQRGQQPGLGFPICRVVGITSLETGALINAVIGRFNGKGGNEQTLLRTIQDSFQANDIVLGMHFSPPTFLSQPCRKKVSILLWSSKVPDEDRQIFAAEKR